MINFFRQIRLKLMNENNTSKSALPVGRYFKYAIGEIALVVIGILIALQINNWNDQRKNTITEAGYYCRILKDFQFNHSLIEDTAKLNSKRIEICKELLVDLNTLPNDRAALLNKFVLAVRQDVFVPSNITFTDITSSGQLRLLSDLKLKDLLIKHNTFLSNILNLLQENRHEIIRRTSNFDLVTEFGYQDMTYLSQELDEEHLALLPKNDWVNEPENRIFIRFQDNLVLLIGLLMRQEQHLSNLKKEMQQPLALLKEKNVISVVFCNSKHIKSA